MKSRTKWLDDMHKDSELETAITCEIDKGASRFNIIDALLEDSDWNDYRGKFSKEQIEESMSKMLKQKVLIETEGDWIQVSAWARDGLEKAFGKDFVSCLKILKKSGVFHRDMILYDVIKLEDAPKWYRDKK